MYNHVDGMNTPELELWSQFIEEIMSEQSKWTKIAFTVSVYVIFIVSVVGNLVTCIVIYYDKSMHTATNYYLFNLAISDLIVTFGIFFVVKENNDRSTDFNNGSDQFGQLTCKIHSFCVVVLWYNGILIMTALAIERYIAICYPMVLQSKPVWRRVAKIIALVWMIAIVEALPEFWVVDLITTRKNYVCFAVPSKMGKILNGVTALLTFIIPLTIMVFVYTVIAFKVNIIHENSHIDRRDRVFNHRDNRSKVNKLTVALTLSFLICWLPFFIMRVMFIFDIRKIMKLQSWWRVGLNITAFCNWFSTVLNPLLFSMMSTKFRKALKTLWDTKIRKNQ